MSSYQDWLREREATRANATRIPTPPPVTVEGDVYVPVLQTLAISLGLFLAVSLFLVIVGVPFLLAVRIGGALGCVSLGVLIVKFILDQRRRITEPLDMVWEKLKALVPGRRNYNYDEEPWVVYNPYRAPQLAATVDHTVPSIEPAVDPRTRRLYDFIVRVWPSGKCTREHCTKTLNIPRRDWERYVGGVRGKEGQESGRGVLDRAGVVEKTAKGWQIVAPLDKAFAINPRLEEYANAKAQLVSPTPPVQAKG